MLEFFEIAIGEGGPLSCCSCASAAAPEPFEVAEISSQMDAVSRLAASPLERNVALVGFEPFAHPALPEIVSSAVDYGLERIRLRTDAGALSLPGNAEGVLGAGVRHFEVVLLGEGETHDLLTGRRGLFAAALEGLARLSEVAERLQADVFISGLMPLCRHNLHQSPLVTATFARAGCRALELDASALVLDQRATATLEAALDTATLNGMHAWVKGSETLPAPYDRAAWRLAEAAS